MGFLANIRCLFCLRKNCYDRFAIGHREYYSHLGFCKVECPKKVEKKIKESYEFADLWCYMIKNHLNISDYNYIVIKKSKEGKNTTLDKHDKTGE